MVDLSILAYSMLSVILVSLVSLVGLVILLLEEKSFRKILLFLVSFSAGALLGDSFIHLLPELINENKYNLNAAGFILFGILMFFIIEKCIQWRHCHIQTSKKHPHPFAIMNLIGDGIHNLIDGLVIGASYLVNIPLGIATTLAVLLHEIPQEISDFGVLLHGGFTKVRAVLYNFFSAVLAIIGALFSVLLGAKFENYDVSLISLTIGGFIYIAASDLIPELHKENRISKSIMQVFGLVLGILVMLSLLLLE